MYRQYKYKTVLDYVAREKPSYLPFVNSNWTNNKRLVQKTFRKISTYKSLVFAKPNVINYN